MFPPGDVSFTIVKPKVELARLKLLGLQGAYRAEHRGWDDHISQGSRKGWEKSTDKAIHPTCTPPPHPTGEPMLTLATPNAGTQWCNLHSSGVLQTNAHAGVDHK